MNQNIVTYLNENKEKYSKDALTAELKKAGYAEGDIAEGIAQVFGLPATVKTSFWNFKDKKVYTKASEKWADFLFGVFVPMLVGFILTPFSYYLRGVMVIFEIATLFLWVLVLVYVFKRRRIMFYGMVFSIAALPLFAAFLLITIMGFH